MANKMPDNQSLFQSALAQMEQLLANAQQGYGRNSDQLFHHIQTYYEGMRYSVNVQFEAEETAEYLAFSRPAFTLGLVAGLRLINMRDHAMKFLQENVFRKEKRRDFVEDVRMALEVEQTLVNNKVIPPGYTTQEHFPHLREIYRIYSQPPGTMFERESQPGY